MKIRSALLITGLAFGAMSLDLQEASAPRVAGVQPAGAASNQSARFAVPALAASSVFQKYNKGRHVNGVSLTAEQSARALVALDAAYRAGFRDAELVTLVSIAGRESNWRPNAHNPNRKTRDNSYGLWQINMIGKSGPKWAKMFGIGSYSDLLDPYVNAHAAMVMCKAMISYGKTCFHGWGPYKGNPPLGSAAKYVEPILALAHQAGYIGGEPKATPIRMLEYGARGQDVRSLQKQLRECGYTKIAADGRFGKRTRLAVRLFQKREGLYVDGIVGPETRAALKEC